MKKIHLNNRNSVEVIFTSDINDDGYDFEIWHSNKNILVFSMNIKKEVFIHFGEIDNYVLSLALLCELIEEAENRLLSKIESWTDIQNE